MDPNMYITESQLSVGLLRNETVYKRDGTAENKNIKTRSSLLSQRIQSRKHLE
jgi:hypothetical protein